MRLRAVSEKRRAQTVSLGACGRQAARRSREERYTHTCVSKQPTRCGTNDETPPPQVTCDSCHCEALACSPPLLSYPFRASPLFLLSFLHARKTLCYSPNPRATINRRRTTMRRGSLTTEPTTTAIRFSRPFMLSAMRDSDMAGRWILLIIRRRSTICAKQQKKKGGGRRSRRGEEEEEEEEEED